jgi:hypothetical protein
MEKVAEQAKVEVVEYDSATLAKEAYDEVFGKKDKLDDGKDKEVAPLKEDTNEEEVVDEKGKEKKVDVSDEKEVKDDDTGDSKPAAKTDEDIVDSDDKDLSEQELTRKKEILEFNEKEEKRVLETEDSKLSKEDLEFKQELLKAKSTETITPEKELETEVRAYAKENNMTEEEIVSEIDAVKKVAEKYANNTFKTARANLHLQKAYSKATNELKELRDIVDAPKEINATQIKNVIDNNQLVLEGQLVPKEKLIAMYRQNYPVIAENLSDEAVVELIAQKVADVNKGNLTVASSAIAEKAKTKRAELLGKVSERGKKYLPEIKQVFDMISDRAIIQDGFNIAEVENMILGTKVADIERAAYERGLKEGKEKTRIIRIPISGSSGAKTSYSSRLSEADRDKAFAMFRDLSEDEAIKAYLEVKPSMKK